MFSGITQFLQTNLLIVLAVVGAIFLGYFFYSQSVIKKQASELTKADVTIENQLLIIEQAGLDAELIKEISADLNMTQERLNKALETNRLKVQRLSEIAKTDLPLAKRLVNEGTKERIRCFEIATGAEPLEDETNSVCPELF